MVDSVIRLYDSSETQFTGNGLGNLSEAISCTVTEELNGAYELEMEYSVDGIHYPELGLRSIIFCKPNPDDDPQPFRVYSITKPINGVVTIHAEHISYDLSGYPVLPFTAENVTGALTALKNASVLSCPFTFQTDKTNSAYFELTEPASLRSILGGTGRSISGVYLGEFEFDRYSVFLHSARGSNRGVKIKYGVNMTDLQQEENCTEVYTGVYPYYSSGEESVTCGVVNAPGTFNYQRIMPLNLSSEFDETPSSSQLRSKALTYISEHQIHVPKVSLTVSFVFLSQSVEYKNYAILETVKLGDFVTVEFTRLGVDALAKCIRTEYNVLTGRYNSVDLGDPRDDIATVITRQKKDIDDVNSSINDLGNDISSLDNNISDLSSDLNSVTCNVSDLSNQLNTVASGYTSITQSVSDQQASIDAIARWQQTTYVNDLTRVETNAKAEIRQTANVIQAEINHITEWQQTTYVNDIRTVQNNAKAYIDQVAGELGASINSVAAWQSTTYVNDQREREVQSKAYVDQVANSIQASINSVAEWQRTTYVNDKTNVERSIAEVRQIANEAGAQISLIAQSGIVGGNGSVNASVIIAAINGQSSVKIKASAIDLQGYVQMTDLNGSSTIINGATIQTGTLKANRLELGSDTYGPALDLGAGLRSDFVRTNQIIPYQSQLNLGGTNVRVEHNLIVPGTLTVENGPLTVNGEMVLTQSVLSGYASKGHIHSGYASDGHTHDITAQLCGYSTTGHSHTGYASSSHGHSGYATTGHTHDLGILLNGYSTTGHSHTGYSSSGHAHNGYAASGHTHTGYSTTGHSHTGYSTTGHTHDFSVTLCGYSTTGHSHTGYSSTGHTHSGYASDGHVHDFAETLNGYSTIGHSHSGYAASGHTHSGYASSGHGHTGYAESGHIHDGYAASGHTHDLSAILNGYSTTGHTHTIYSKIGHTHSGYSTTGHTHDLTGYSTTGHTHSGYSTTGHTHDLTGYSTTGHTHSGYSTTGHTHSGYSTTGHTHSGYAASGHSHSGYAASSHTHSFTGYSTTGHTHSGYAASGHSHSGYAASSHTHSFTGYSTTGHTHSGYAASGHSHSGYAASSHTHSGYITAGALSQHYVIVGGCYYYIR